MIDKAEGKKGESDKPMDLLIGEVNHRISSLADSAMLKPLGGRECNCEGRKLIYGKAHP